MNKNFKRNAIAAAGVATILSLVVASPSLAHDGGKKGKGAAAGSSTSAHVVSGTAASLAVTVTAVPTTVTDAASAARGASFTVYTLDATATAVPATQPTTGGKKVHVQPTGTLANGTLTATLMLKGGAASTTTNYAIYPANGGAAIFATVTVDANSVATVTSSAALTAAYVAPTAPALGEGKGMKGKKGKGMKDGAAKAGIPATVNVPADGKTYSIKVTETAEKGVAVATPVARPAIALTATGSQTVKLGLGASDTYKIELVAADGTVVSTVTVTVAADGTVATPIVLG